MTRNIKTAIGPKGSKRRSRLITLTVILAAVAMIPFMPGVLAVHDDGAFELDRNASNDTNVTLLGELGPQVKVGDTEIDVCEFMATPPAPFTILIEAERFTVTSAADGSFGGSCSGTKTTYAVGAAATAGHSGSGVSSRVSLVEEGVVEAGPDWDQVHSEFTTDGDCDDIGLVACTYIEDGIGPTTFIGGASKDHLPIGGWMHTSGASPDKAEILNAYAAKDIVGGRQILYFGMDRYAVDGSTDIGFWFFRNPVVANGDGTFTGVHSLNDLLILGTFTQGGAASQVRVFRWVGVGGNESGTIQGPDATFGDCVPGAANDDGCATVNDTSIEVPWNYSFKGADEGMWVPAGGFFEGGIDLTGLGLEGCFSSFLAETRSSPEITAILKDFTLGSFEACGSGLTTTPANGTGTALTDSGTNGIPDVSIGTGTVTVKDQADLDITGISEWDGTLDFYLCGPLAAPSTCDTGGVQIGTSTSVDESTVEPILSAAATLTEAGRYCWRGEFDSSTTGVPDATDSSSGECFEVLPAKPSISTVATGPVTVGAPLDDTATLLGTATRPGTDGGGANSSIDATPGSAANGTITFKLYGPSATAVCVSTNLIGTSVVSVSGDGDYDASDATVTGTFTPTAAGTYYWVASYSGDSPNTLSVSGVCGETGETSVLIQFQPAIGTAQSFVPNDSATISVASGAGNLAGTVVFKLFVNNETCVGTADYTSSAIDVTTGVGNGLSRTVVSTNTTAYSTEGDTTFHWVVEYTSTNPGHKDVTSACATEVSSITIDNDTSD